MTLIKILGPNRESIHGGRWTWEPGEWTPETHPVVCVTGWHLVPPWDVGEWWRPDCTVWEAEGRGRCNSQGPKTAWAQARILRQLRTPTLPELVGWAADCAERALPHVPPGEGRPVAAIAAARAWVECPCATHAAANAAANAEAAQAAAEAAEAASYAVAYAAHAAAYAAAYAAEAAEAASYAVAYASYAVAYAANAAANAEAAHAAYAAIADAAYAAAASAHAHAAAHEHMWQDGHMMALLEPQ